MVTSAFCRAARAFLRDGGRPEEIDESLADDWLDAVRERIYRAAEVRGEQPRAFAATLIGVVAGPEATAILQVGDGACAFRLAEEEEWRVPIWPAQGEYAATTSFVIDSPFPIKELWIQPGGVEEIALFTDGIERLALDFRSRTAFPRFFETMFPALRKAPAGRQRTLSNDLRAFLDGASVTSRTDDDKTLIMARPIGSEPEDNIAENLRLNHDN